MVCPKTIESGSGLAASAALTLCMEGFQLYGSFWGPRYNAGIMRYLIFEHRIKDFIIVYMSRFEPQNGKAT